MDKEPIPKLWNLKFSFFIQSNPPPFLDKEFVRIFTSKTVNRYQILATLQALRQFWMTPNGCNFRFRRIVKNFHSSFITKAQKPISLNKKLFTNTPHWKIQTKSTFLQSFKDLNPIPEYLKKSTNFNTSVSLHFRI